MYAICVICKNPTTKNDIIGNVGMATQDTPTCDKCINSTLIKYVTWYNKIKLFNCLSFCWAKGLKGSYE